MAPYDHMDLDVPIAQYLHERGIVRALDADQTGPGDRASIFIGLMDESEGEAVAVRAVNVQQDDHDSNPRVTFTITCRSLPHDLLGAHALSSRVFAALHTREDRLTLTAGRGVVYCTRALTGATVPDGNQRHVRVDTYTARVLVPRTL